MKDGVAAVEESKRGAVVHFESGERLWFGRAAWLERTPLRPGDVEDLDGLKQWLLPRLYPKALGGAVRLLAARARSTGEIRQKLEAGAVVAMCIEGKTCSSEALSKKLADFALEGKSRVTFLIGGSFGLDETLKKQADWRLSMSPMTFPHHLARVMLAEQIYRACTINAGTQYHK